MLSIVNEGKSKIKLIKKEKSIILKFNSVQDALEWEIFLSEAKKVHLYDNTCEKTC